MGTRAWSDERRRQHLAVIDLEGRRHAAERAHTEVLTRYIEAGHLSDPDERRRARTEIQAELRTAWNARQRAVHAFLAANRRLREMG